MRRTVGIAPGRSRSGARTYCRRAAASKVAPFSTSMGRPRLFRPGPGRAGSLLLRFGVPAAPRRDHAGPPPKPRRRPHLAPNPVQHPITFRRTFIEDRPPLPLSRHIAEAEVLQRPDGEDVEVGPPARSATVRPSRCPGAAEVAGAEAGGQQRQERSRHLRLPQPRPSRRQFRLTCAQLRTVRHGHLDQLFEVRMRVNELEQRDRRTGAVKLRRWVQAAAEPTPPRRPRCLPGALLLGAEQLRLAGRAVGVALPRHALVGEVLRQLARPRRIPLPTVARRRSPHPPARGNPSPRPAGRCCGRRRRRTAGPSAVRGRCAARTSC